MLHLIETVWLLVFSRKNAPVPATILKGVTAPVMGRKIWVRVET